MPLATHEQEFSEEQKIGITKLNNMHIEVALAV